MNSIRNFGKGKYHCSWYTIFPQINTIVLIRRLFRTSGGAWMAGGNRIGAVVHNALHDEAEPIVLP
jgi:hypothetical protein